MPLGITSHVAPLHPPARPLLAGNSVCVFVHGFEPYFYVEAPTQQWTPDDSEELAKRLNVSQGAGSSWQGVWHPAVPWERQLGPAVLWPLACLVGPMLRPTPVGALPIPEPWLARNPPLNCPCPFSPPAAAGAAARQGQERQPAQLPERGAGAEADGDALPACQGARVPQDHARHAEPGGALQM